MDLTYMPGELDVKHTQKNDGSENMKREHDSVDDFEHLDPDLSPVNSKDFLAKETVDNKNDSKDHSLPAHLGDGDDSGLFQKPIDSLTDNISSNSKLPEFDTKSHEIKTNVDLHFDSEFKPSQLNFELNPGKSAPEPEDRFEHSANKNFISAEVSSNIYKAERENESLNHLTEDNDKETQEKKTKDAKSPFSLEQNVGLTEDLDFSNTGIKSMKEDDALPQYEKRYEHKESPKDDNFAVSENEPQLPLEPEFSKPDPLGLVEIPEPKSNSPELISHLEPTEEFLKSHEEIKEKHPSVEEPTKPELIKPIQPVTKDSDKTPVKKMTISDLDDIIGPEDVFKRIGLVEALVYWRDPKKSGVVFGGIMAILLSLCYMSLISVVAYSSLFALTGTICFRIYKNILQAVQKTSEGHPFKEFLELELSLPQDKVREIVDTAVVHINAAVVELRRLFLVEDLIDSIKFGVCLWCLTYVGAIFNGMTLVILAFVALFTVPKIYENNKASIDQYIDIGRSKVAEITSNEQPLPAHLSQPDPPDLREQLTLIQDQLSKLMLTIQGINSLPPVPPTVPPSQQPFATSQKPPVLSTNPLFDWISLRPPMVTPPLPSDDRIHKMAVALLSKSTQLTSWDRHEVNFVLALLSCWENLDAVMRGIVFNRMNTLYIAMHYGSETANAALAFSDSTLAVFPLGFQPQQIQQPSGVPSGHNHQQAASVAGTAPPAAEWLPSLLASSESCRTDR